MRIDDNEFLIELDDKKFQCAMDLTMEFIGGKWKTVVLWYLRKEKKRYNELRKLMPQITERMLSIQLKKLEEDGLVKRQVFTDKPPLKVEYSLTDYGKTLVPVLEEIAKWGRKTAQEKGNIIKIR